MFGLGEVTQLAHAAQNGHATAFGLQRGQRAQTGDHAVRIRVVAVVDETDALNDFRLYAASGEFGVAQSIRDVGGRNAVAPAHARGEGCIGHHVLAEDGEARFDLLAAEIEREGRAGAISAEIRGADIACVHASGGNGGLAVTGDDGGVFVVRVQHDDAAALHLSRQRGLFPSDGILRAHVFDVGHADIRDDACIGVSDVGEHLDLAGMIHAHLGDAALLTAFERKQRQRHADVVVEVSEGRARDELFRHDDCGEVFGRCFAV